MSQPVNEDGEKRPISIQTEWNVPDMRPVFNLLFLALLLAACTHTPAIHTPPEKSTATTTVDPSPLTPAPAVKPPQLPLPTTMPDNKLVVFHTSGGIAGLDELLTVYRDGRLEFEDRRRNHRVETRVKPEQTSKLQELISDPEYGKLRLEYLARGADLFRYQVSTWTSDGKERTVTTMDTATQPDILSQVLSELNRLRRFVP